MAIFRARPKRFYTLHIDEEGRGSGDYKICVDTLFVVPTSVLWTQLAYTIRKQVLRQKHSVVHWNIRTRALCIVVFLPELFTLSGILCARVRLTTTAYRASEGLEEQMQMHADALLLVGTTTIDGGS